MGRKFGKVKSFSGRLTFSTSTTDVHSTCSNISELSTSTPNMADECSECERLEHRARLLAEQLTECRADLTDSHRELARLQSERTDQLGSICRQVMLFESGLRRKQRELGTLLKQRDRIIREQNCIIRFLMTKTGTTRNVGKLYDEAIAKIPQVCEGSTVLTSITESTESEKEDNDSDSAIILDDSVSSSSSSLKKSRRISRSVSDVVTDCDTKCNNSNHVSATPLPPPAPPPATPKSDEEDEGFHLPFSSAHYRGFLLRHGSYERYKVRSSRLRISGEHVHDTSDAAEEHVRTSGEQLTSEQPPDSLKLTHGATRQASINHRSVTKPRDIKNRHNNKSKTRMKDDGGVLILTNDVASVSFS